MNNFISEIKALGKTDRERATRLGVSAKTIFRFRSGYLPDSLLCLMRFPRLLGALAKDALAMEKEEERG